MAMLHCNISFALHHERRFSLPVSKATASVVVLKVLSLFPHARHGNFKTKNHMRIIELLVSLSNPKFVQSVLHSVTNFGFGTLGSCILSGLFGSFIYQAGNRSALHCTVGTPYTKGVKVRLTPEPDLAHGLFLALAALGPARARHIRGGSLPARDQWYRSKPNATGISQTELHRPAPDALVGDIYATFSEEVFNIPET